MKSTTNLQGVMPKSGLLNWSNGNHAPMYMKQAQFRSWSTTEEKASSPICLLRYPSQFIAVPRAFRVNGESSTLGGNDFACCEGCEQIIATQGADNSSC